MYQMKGEDEVNIQNSLEEHISDRYKIGPCCNNFCAEALGFDKKHGGSEAP